MTYAGGSIHAGSRDLAHATAPRSLLRRFSIRHPSCSGMTFSGSSTDSSSNNARRNRLPCFRETDRRYALTSLSCMTSSTVTRGISSASDTGSDPFGITPTPDSPREPKVATAICDGEKGRIKAFLVNNHEHGDGTATLVVSSPSANEVFRLPSASPEALMAGPEDGPPAAYLRAVHQSRKAGLAGPSFCLPQIPGGAASQAVRNFPRLPFGLGVTSPRGLRKRVKSPVSHPPLAKVAVNDLGHVVFSKSAGTRLAPLGVFQ